MRRCSPESSAGHATCALRFFSKVGNAFLLLPVITIVKNKSFVSSIHFSMEILQGILIAE
jgi:hypothetical protein